MAKSARKDDADQGNKNMLRNVARGHQLHEALCHAFGIAVGHGDRTAVAARLRDDEGNPVRKEWYGGALRGRAGLELMVSWAAQAGLTTVMDSSGGLRFLPDDADEQAEVERQLLREIELVEAGSDVKGSDVEEPAPLAGGAETLEDDLHRALCRAFGIEEGHGSQTAVAARLTWPDGRPLSRQVYLNGLDGSASLETKTDWAGQAGLLTVVGPAGGIRFESGVDPAAERLVGLRYLRAMLQRIRFERSERQQRYAAASEEGANAEGSVAS